MMSTTEYNKMIRPLILLTLVLAFQVLANQTHPETLNTGQNEVVSFNTKPTKSIANATSLNQTESFLLKSLKSLKLSTSLVPNSKKKSIYPGILIENFYEKELTEEASNDLTKFGAYSKLLSQLMHTIVNKDLKLTAMQRLVDEQPTEVLAVKHEILIDDMANKVS